jgi:hypothetical protein
MLTFHQLFLYEYHGDLSDGEQSTYFDSLWPQRIVLSTDGNTIGFVSTQIGTAKLLAHTITTSAFIEEIKAPKPSGLERLQVKSLAGLRYHNILDIAFFGSTFCLATEPDHDKMIFRADFIAWDCGTTSKLWLQDIFPKDAVSTTMAGSVEHY